MRVTDDQYAELVERRWCDPAGVAAALATRKRRTGPLPGSIFIVAADHSSRGALGIRDEPLAMADRHSLLERLAEALANASVDGVLASADILEDLALLGLLEGRLAYGTMNRGGLMGARWELDDRFTAYDAAHVASIGLDGGKMLLRIDDEDPGTIPTLESCARAVTELADRGLHAMVEPLPYRKNEHGGAVLDPSEEKLIRAMGVASGLGASAAYTWLKVPASADVERVMRISSLPALILGGAPGRDPAAALARWERALALPTVRGLVVGRTLLYPVDGDVARAVETAGALVEARR